MVRTVVSSSGTPVVFGYVISRGALPEAKTTVSIRGVTRHFEWPEDAGRASQYPALRAWLRSRTQTHADAFEALFFP